MRTVCVWNMKLCSDLTRELDISLVPQYRSDPEMMSTHPTKEKKTPLVWLSLVPQYRSDQGASIRNESIATHRVTDRANWPYRCVPTHSQQSNTDHEFRHVRTLLQYEHTLGQVLHWLCDTGRVARVVQLD